MKYFTRLFKDASKYRGYMALATFTTFFGSVVTLGVPYIIRLITGGLNNEENPLGLKMLLILCGAILLSYILRAVFNFITRYFAHVAAWGFVGDIRVRVYQRYQELSIGFYHDKQTGDLMARNINDTSSFEALMAHSIPDAFSGVVTFAAVLVILFLMNPVLAAYMLIPIPFLAVASVIFALKIRPRFRAANKEQGKLYGIVQDNLSGMKEIQGFSQEPREKRRVRNQADSYTKSILRALLSSAVYHPYMELFTALGTFIVVLAGGLLAYFHGLPVEDITAFVLYTAMLYAPIGIFARILEEIQTALAAAERVYFVLDSVPDVAEKPDAYEMPLTEGNIEFDNVSFRYIENVAVLNNVSFKAAKGEMVALVGATGAGKSTIAGLLERFYDATDGAIRIDGHNVRDVTIKSLRENISIVLQDVFLFNGTVAENIAYGNENASREEITEAAAAANAHGFIEALPEGYDSMIGERGAKLSGGQKQRLSIARSILKNAPILILDEATASVDVQTEAEIQKSIQNIAGTRTILVIAHRLSTIKRADKILVLQEGTITQAGTHAELMAQGGYYADLIEMQERFS